MDPNKAYKTYILHKATYSLPLVYDSPHSGQDYPKDFDYSCCEFELKKSEDCFVNEFFEDAALYDACYLGALFPRSYIDVNRSLIDDIDTELHEHNANKNPSHSPSPRARAGIGLIRRLLKADTPIYNKKLCFKEVEHRIENYYIPYHNALQSLIDSLHHNHGQVWHVNCHSMPSGKIQWYNNGYMPRLMPDFVIGDRDGTSCSREFTNLIRNFLDNKGYKVKINDPYKGVEIVKRHGLPHLNRHSVQLEINKALYMDESGYTKSRNFNKLKSDINDLKNHISQFVRNQQIPAAAD